MNHFYILDEHGTPVPEPDIGKWRDWYQKHEHAHRLSHDTHDGILISTIFLGMNHSYDPDPNAPPVLWETMIFGGINDNYQKRYTSQADALAGHSIACAAVKNNVKIGIR